ncbi:MAG: site-specific DNA-methyltransferase, partial [Bacteroidetes bacterium]|nr:site-specific DNA-methyltransferase [Bacteroidota bacterium]
MHRIINADVYAGLKSIEDGSIDIAVTSPPYWGQRDYEFEGQIGIEGSFTEYIEKLVSIFNVLQKKLKSRGVFYLNIGDKYLSKYGNSSLGLIPYKLAYQMTRFGWHLCDIIIWYKPNHMPSSISNRFSTTYEPIF